MIIIWRLRVSNGYNIIRQLLWFKKKKNKNNRKRVTESKRPFHTPPPSSPTWAYGGFGLGRVLYRRYTIYTSYNTIISMTNNVVKMEKILHNNYNIIKYCAASAGRRLLFVFVFVPATAVVSCSLVPRTAAARRAAGSMSRGWRACARAYRRRLWRGGIGSLGGHHRRRAREKRDAQLRPQVAHGGNSRGSTVIDTLRVDRIMF